MNLSDGEKLILLMLSDIQEAQNIKGSIDPGIIKSAIYYDCTWGLPWEYPGIPFDNTETPARVKEITDILQMWTMIEASYATLSQSDKEMVEREAQPFGADPKFMGFDRTSEGEEYQIVVFLVEHLKRFLNFKGRDFSSTIPLGGRYRRMYKVYEPMIRDLGMKKLGAVELTRILLQGA